MLKERMIRRQGRRNRDSAPRVVILGGGFAGINAARALKGAPVRVTVIDRQNYHLFQPLLYQVATASFSPAEVASPIRSILRKQENAEVWLAEVLDVDLQRRRVRLEDSEVAYDSWSSPPERRTPTSGTRNGTRLRPGSKRWTTRSRSGAASCWRSRPPSARRTGTRACRLLTFVIVGAGPTGVELAGAMSEIARQVMPHDFRFIDTTTAQVILVEGADRVLPTFPPELSAKAQRQLEALGVEVRTGAMVTGIDEEGVDLGTERIEAGSVFWAAGVAASPIGAALGAARDRAGRVTVEPDCSVPGHPEVFVVGDLAHLEHDGHPLPGVAQVAIHTGRHAARMIRVDLAGAPRQPFRYRDLGSLATIGRWAAVADFGRLRFSGALAWWLWAYLTYQRGIRLITGNPKMPLARPRRRGGYRFRVGRGESLRKVERRASPPSAM